MTSAFIIGVGNPWRSDDGIGPYVAGLLCERGFDAIEESGEGARLIAAFEGRDFVILVDAMRSGAAVGTVRRFEPLREPLPSGLFHYSSHQFALAEAVETARAIGRLPAHLVIFGIEGIEFGYGNELSVPVRGAAEEVVAAIIRMAPLPRAGEGGSSL